MNAKQLDKLFASQSDAELSKAIRALRGLLVEYPKSKAARKHLDHAYAQASIRCLAEYVNRYHQ
jgi:hypothetical protein